MGGTDDPLKGATRDQGSSVTTADGRESDLPRFYLLASSPCLQPGYAQVGPLLPEDAPWMLRVLARLLAGALSSHACPVIPDAAPRARRRLPRPRGD